MSQFNLEKWKKPPKKVGIAVTILCVIIIALGVLNPQKAELPFGHTYEGGRQYTFTIDRRLEVAGAEAMIPNRYKSIKLTEDNFDAYFKKDIYNNSTETVESLRENNYKAWYLEQKAESLEGISDHYLLLQKNNEVYMVRGKIYTKEVDGETAENSWLAEITKLTRIDTPEYKSDKQVDWGLTLSVENVTPTSATIVCVREGGDPVGDIETGADYSLQKKGIFGWQDVKMKDLMFVNSTLHFIDDGETKTWNVVWEKGYGELGRGTYRVVKTFEDLVDEVEFYAEFEIE